MVFWHRSLQSIGTNYSGLYIFDKKKYGIQIHTNNVSGIKNIKQIPFIVQICQQKVYFLSGTRHVTWEGWHHRQIKLHILSARLPLQSPELAPPAPSPASEWCPPGMPPPLWFQGGVTLFCGREGGGSQSGRWNKLSWRPQKNGNDHLIFIQYFLSCETKNKYLERSNIIFGKCSVSVWAAEKFRGTMSNYRNKYRQHNINVLVYEY